MDRSDFKVWENNKITIEYKKYIENYLTDSKNDLLNNSNFGFDSITKYFYRRGQIDSLTTILDINYNDLF